MSKYSNEHLIFGPDVEYVRYDIEKCFWEQQKESKSEINTLLMQKCMYRILPLSRTYFGTWRSYEDFGKRQIKKSILRIYDNEIENAKIVLSTSFVPICMYKLYNPETGWMVKKKQIEFNIKKSELNKKK